jgi:hypothetical protein
VFCEDKLGDHQDDMLRVAYGVDFGPHSEEIQRAALLRAFAKPALSALVLQVLTAKLEILLRAKIDPVLGVGAGDALRAGLIAGRNAIASIAPNSPDDMAGYMRSFIRGCSRCIGLFRAGQVRDSVDHTYEPISPLPLSQMKADPNVLNSGLGLLALSLSLVGLQIPKGVSIEIDPVGAVQKGAFEAKGAWEGATWTRMFFAQDAAVALSLTDQGALSGTQVVVLHADDTWRRMRADAGRRSPRGSATDTRVKHISLPQLLAESSTASQLEQRFLEEVTL